MRPSPKRHTLAILRTLLGLTQKELAELVQCSRPTIQAVELGKLRISVALATRISLETNVHPIWLLENDVTKRPISAKGLPYSRETYEEARACLLSPPQTDVQAVDELLNAWALFKVNINMLAELFGYAYRNNKILLAAYRQQLALSEIIWDLVKPAQEADAICRKSNECIRHPDLIDDVIGVVHHYFNETFDEFGRRLKAAKQTVPPELQKRFVLPVQEKSTAHRKKRSEP